ncbi:hypothetical protein DYBT9275_02224 [Dyadobacter sp. CECT 9275]|uniref:DJ-1/PfpI domain-containing protein n=2 Tax=Dyadobacter helix TaxID=2822344 RepID=A0A916NL77_9BACT|nr:hypothetical protein DYBT9275_02224 [Dyadobacter sp. CECT 9275]
MAFAAGIILAFHYLAAAQNNPSMSMKTKILFVVTSHDQKGNTGEPTGYYLSEVSHPWEVLHNAGYVIDFVSPKGGKAPVDGFNLDDNVNSKFWNDKTYRYKVEHTFKPSEINPDDYAAIFYAGGHGAMWDLADNTELAKIAQTIYEQNGVVSAVLENSVKLTTPIRFKLTTCSGRN